MLLCCLQHGAAWFVRMRAVVEATFLREVEYVLEITCQFFGFHIERTEALYTRSIDKISALGQFEHLRERRGVHTSVVRIANLRCTQIGSRQDVIDEGRLTYTAITAQQCLLILQHRRNGIHAQSRSGRHGYTLVTHRLVQTHHHLLVVSLLVREYIGLVEHQHCRHAVCLRRSEEAVDEDGTRLRIVHRNDEECLVDVGSDDVALLAEVLRLAYDINVLEKDTEIRFTLRFPKPEWYELYERELEECDRFIWITDACMRDGIIRKVKAKIEEYGGLLLADIPDRITPYEIGRDAFESKEEALKHAEERRTYLIELTKKQLNELENLKFECDD